MAEDEINKEGTKEDNGNGDKPEIPSSVKLANEAAERLEQANIENRKLVERQEALAAHNALGGTSEAGSQPVKPKRLTDTEYSEALERGEANPLHEDGYI